MVQLAPSILSADFSRLGESVSKIEKAGAHIIHVDVMDGHFVPNISFGAAVMKSLEGKSRLPFDVHLMIEDPDKYLEDFVTDQTEYITVHQEACIHLNRTLQHIKSLGVKAGVALNPATSLSTLDYCLEDVDMVLIMTVQPGFGGQKYMDECTEKIQELRELIDEEELDVDIQVDGGINDDTLETVMRAGANLMVAGSWVFKGDVAANVRHITEKIHNIKKELD